MHPRGPLAANRLKDLLEELELVGGEGIGAGEVVGTLELRKRHSALREAELVFEDVAGGREGVGEPAANGRGIGLGEQPLLDHLVDVGTREGKPGRKPALDLAEVVLGRRGHVAEDLVELLLSRDHHPGPALTDGAEVLDDRLEVEHQPAVAADERSHLVHQEHEPAALCLLVEVVLHVFGERLDAELEAAFRAIHPLLGRRLRLAGGLRESLHHLVAVEGIGVAFGFPGMAGEPLKLGPEGVELSLLVEVPLHVGDVGMLRAVAGQLVENLQEHREDGIAVAANVGSAVDVEEDDVGVAGGRLLDVAEREGIRDLGGEELSRPFGLTLVGVGGVGEDVGEDLDQVGFTGAEEAGHPDPYPTGDVEVAGVVEAGSIGTEESLDVAGELAGDHKLIELLPDGGLVGLIGLHDAVDGPEDVFLEEVADGHRLDSGGSSRKAR